MNTFYKQGCDISCQFEKHPVNILESLAQIFKKKRCQITLLSTTIYLPKEKMLKRVIWHHFL